MPNRHTAVHGAGRFVFGFLHGLKATSISIVADKDAATAGRVLQRGSHQGREQGVVQVRTRCACCAALVAAGNSTINLKS